MKFDKKAFKRGFDDVFFMRPLLGLFRSNASRMNIRGRIEEYDTGEVIDLSSYSGGGSPEGAWGSVTLMQTSPDGTVRFRRYQAVSDWIKPTDLGKIQPKQ